MKETCFDTQMNFDIQFKKNKINISVYTELGDILIHKTIFKKSK